ncbi:hypothetical protein AB5N19_09402 [Seiridium cardinale]
MALVCILGIRVQSIVWILLGAVRAGSISTWWYPEALAPQVIMYDQTSGKILYSLCNSNSTPIFPANETAAFDLDPNFPPMNGTSVAGTGYMLQNSYIAVVHYQEEKGGIVHSLWTCDSTGHYFKGDGQGSWNVSAGIGVTIHNNTGLAVVNLGGDAQIGGFRVYFKDMENRTAALRYTILDSWEYDGFVSQDMATSLEIAASFANPKRTTVVSPWLHDDENQAIEACTLTHADTWEIVSFPSPLFATRADNASEGLQLPITNNTNTSEWSLWYNDPNWSLDAFDGSNSKIALSADSDTFQTIYYIGTDQGLHGLTGYNTTWNKTLREPDDNWPLADEINAPFALAYDALHNETWIYYISNGSMTQVHQSNEETWEKAITLPKFNSTPPDVTSSSADSSGLSSGANTGIGVGIGLGIPFLIAAIAAYMYFHIKRSRANREAERAAVNAAHADATSPPVGSMQHSHGKHPSMSGSPVPGYTSGYWEGRQWVDGQWAPAQAGIQPYLDQIYGKPEGDLRQSYGYYDNNYGTLSPQAVHQPMFELENEEPRHEMHGDGQVPELPVVAQEPQEPAVETQQPQEPRTAEHSQ